MVGLFDYEVKQDPKKMTRILVYPNITFSKNLEQDSYVQVLKNMITELNKIRDDLFWYILSPKTIQSLEFSNTVQYQWALPTYPPAMRSHFDVMRFKDICSNDIDIDIVMSHLPEHTHAVVNTLYNLTHHMPKVFGYTHWFDFDDVVVWEKGAFNQNILGLLEMQTCYINTQAQKDKVLAQASKVFTPEIITKLDNILTVQHLGVQIRDIKESPKSDVPKTIVFNHRPDTYKHFPEFVSLMDRLWETRKDFRVWVPLASKPTREWMYCDKFDKAGYYEHLHSQCLVGFSPKQVYCGWSVSTTDGMMNGVPYIMYDATYYRELWSGADFFTTDDEALKLLNKYLDDPEYRNQKGAKAIIHLHNSLLYRDKMVQMSDRIDEIVGSLRARDSDKAKELAEIVRQKGPLTKSELFKYCPWGRGIKWTGYRQSLMRNPHIFDQQGITPKYMWVDNE